MASKDLKLMCQRLVYTIGVWTVSEQLGKKKIKHVRFVVKNHNHVVNVVNMETVRYIVIYSDGCNNIVLRYFDVSLIIDDALILQGRSILLEVKKGDKNKMFLTLCASNTNIVKQFNFAI